MFQYATGRSIAYRLNVPLILDAGGFANYDLRRYELDSMEIKGRLATQGELIAAGVNLAPPTLLTRIKKSLGFNRPMNHFAEASFTYDSRIEQLSSPAYLDGYWQSERYFADIADLLRQEFSLKEPANESNAAMHARIVARGHSSVSLHIRRGDYVSNAQTAQYHGVCSLDYYRQAAQYVAERLTEPHFFVFSDDLAWVKEHLQLPYSLTLMDVNSADRGVWDMALMRTCHHHIIANSSFSWWGAWLNHHADKIVVCPQRWFSGASHDTRDLIPAKWVRI